VAGFLIQRGDDVVLAVLVGHAHHDHLMDLPYVWQKRPGATLYGNFTMGNILAACDGRVHAALKMPSPQ